MPLESVNCIHSWFPHWTSCQPNWSLNCFALIGFSLWRATKGAKTTLKAHLGKVRQFAEVIGGEPTQQSVTFRDWKELIGFFVAVFSCCYGLAVTVKYPSLEMIVGLDGKGFSLMM